MQEKSVRHIECSPGSIQIPCLPIDHEPSISLLFLFPLSYGMTNILNENFLVPKLTEDPARTCRLHCFPYDRKFFLVSVCVFWRTINPQPVWKVPFNGSPSSSFQLFIFFARDANNLHKLSPSPLHPIGKRERELGEIRFGLLPLSSFKFNWIELEPFCQM